MNAERDALLAALADARLPAVGLSWPMLSLVALACVLALAALAVLLLRWRQRRRRQAAARAWRQAAQQALSTLEHGGRALEHDADPAAAQRWLSQASVLARRVALVAFEREEIAGLTGDAWLARLDALLGEKRFSEPPVDVLAAGPYRAPQVLESGTPAAITAALQALIDAVERRRSVQA